MSRKLLLIRHAHADGSSPDLERPLSSQGERRARELGEALYEAGILPDVVLCSPARRTRATWAIMEEVLGKPSARVVADLYGADPRTLLEVMATAPDQARTVALVAHNPGVSRLVRTVAEGPPPHLRAFSPGDAALLECGADTWAEAVNETFDAIWRG